MRDIGFIVRALEGFVECLMRCLALLCTISTSTQHIGSVDIIDLTDQNHSASLKMSVLPNQTMLLC